MKLFAFDHHRRDNPWDEAPAWAIELREISLINLNLQEAIMAASDDLKAAVADLSAQMTVNNTAIDGLLAKITAPGTSDADIQAAVSQIHSLIDGNKAELAKITPPAA